MSWESFKSRGSDFWGEFRRDRSGMVGLAILVLFVAAAAFEWEIIPFPRTDSRWNDITYWEDNPGSAPPVWTNWFHARKAAVSSVLHHSGMSEQSENGVSLVMHRFTYDFRYDLPPRDIVLRFTGSGKIPLAVDVQRPDGQRIDLYQEQASVGNHQHVRVSIAQSAQDAVVGFLLRYESPQAMTTLDMAAINPVSVVFSQAHAGMLSDLQPLKGEYVFTLSTLLLGRGEQVADPFLVVTGMVSGLLGTDSSKRDIWSGIIAGVKWALLIGLLTSFVAVGVGVIYGIISAYFSGVTDALMQRVFEIFVNMPLLPILIVMSAVFKPNIWFLILMMSAFFWVGPVKTIRSMALQIKSETYIEASRALGAGSFRIIFRHMVPLLVPYSFASMALAVPSAVVYEATVSLLGLGDATIVTWGQILHAAFTGNAVLNGLWWWVIPPGIMIALMGMTFSFIGFAMDTILQPKLRTR
jgi:peptide/nickel transport system permease protein